MSAAKPGYRSVLSISPTKASTPAETLEEHPKNKLSEFENHLKLLDMTEMNHTTAWYNSVKTSTLNILLIP